MQGCQSVFLHVIDYNREAMSFYSRHAFSRTRLIKGAGLGAPTLVEDLRLSVFLSRRDEFSALSPARRILFHKARTDAPCQEQGAATGPPACQRSAANARLHSCVWIRPSA